MKKKEKNESVKYIWSWKKEMYCMKLSIFHEVAVYLDEMLPLVTLM